jgi:hypothetical protein
MLFYKNNIILIYFYKRPLLYFIINKVFIIIKSLLLSF